MSDTANQNLVIQAASRIWPLGWHDLGSRSKRLLPQATVPPLECIKLKWQQCFWRNNTNCKRVKEYKQPMHSAHSLCRPIGPTNRDQIPPPHKFTSPCQYSKHHFWPFSGPIFQDKFDQKNDLRATLTVTGTQVQLYLFKTQVISHFSGSSQPQNNLIFLRF